MSDHELLEAAGIKVEQDGKFAFPNGLWNPLTDDGDALRLLVSMPFITLYVSEIGATASWPRGCEGHGWKCDEYADEHGGDLLSATRRAIVRAAAAMAKEKAE